MRTSARYQRGGRNEMPLFSLRDMVRLVRNDNSRQSTPAQIISPGQLRTINSSVHCPPNCTQARPRKPSPPNPESRVSGDTCGASDQIALVEFNARLGQQPFVFVDERKTPQVCVSPAAV